MIKARLGHAFITTIIDVYEVLAVFSLMFNKANTSTANNRPKT